MSKYSDRWIGVSAREAIWDEFCSLVAQLKTKDNVKRFFSDLLNRQERVMLARRLHIAALLEAGFTYDQIKRTLHTGSTTIGRIQRWLNFGRDGYKRMIRLLPTKDKKILRDRFRTLYR